MSQRLRLGPWLVFPDSNEIVSGDESVKVEPRVMRVLVHLARHSNEVVPREQILKAVWDGVFVSDEVLTNAVREARKALGDDAKEPEFIQTIPKQGYRLLASVSWEEVEETPPTKPVRFERPYPGLAPFSEDEAEFFFGREEEVEAVWGKLNRFHLLGLFGPSGAGKSSFVRAGLMPARPEGWRGVICHPGEKPFLALAYALVPEFAGDTEATRELLRLDESDTALSLLEQWRKKYPEVLLCIDQFEELFTLNRQDVQTRFAELVGRLGQELGIHILLAIRDDFLIHCDHHPMLSPIFKELTPLNPPRGAALRRALVEPAKRCGYHFDDESLVTEMLSEVTKERGALPLLAFAAARLWEKRDLDRRVLTRIAYLETGGVAGALAQHAEATLERVGNDRIPMVRELFRNLVTAQGTRAARDKEEILSVFEDRDAAARVLHELIDARLLTSFEAPGLEGEESSQRVEIIHESLLTAWPRLVRWQTQDADSAQLRDQLRQAAHMWQERGRPADLLWTGTSFKEYQVWRENYPGGLTTAEEAFASAMVQHAERRRRRRRFVAVSGFGLLLAVVAVVSTLWQRSVAETRRAEAARLRSLGQLELEERPSAAIAYAIASLELHDDPEVRRFALEALWKGPTELWINAERYLNADFSPDGRWLALTHTDVRQIHVFPTAGGEPLVLESDNKTPFVEQFGTQSHYLLSSEGGAGEGVLELWSIPEGRRCKHIYTDGLGAYLSCFPVADDRAVLLTRDKDQVLVYSLAKAWDAPLLLGRLPAQEIRGDYWWAAYRVDPSGCWLAYANETTVYISALDDLETSRPLGRHEQPIWSVTFSSDGDRLASVDTSGQIQIWSRTQVNGLPLLTIETGDENLRGVQFDATGSRLVTAFNTSGVAAIWDLSGPPDADPPFLYRRPGGWLAGADFDPSGRWVVIGRYGAVAYPLMSRYPRIFRGHRGWIKGLAFAPDGSWVASSSMAGDLIQWPLSPDAGTHSRALLDKERLFQTAVDPQGRFLVVGSHPNPIIVDLRDGSTRELESDMDVSRVVAVGPQGRRIAAASNKPEDIQVWDLETGEVRILDTGKQVTVRLQFTPEGRLLASNQSGDVFSWNVDEGTSKVLLEKSVRRFDISRDGRTLVGEFNSRITVYDLENGSRRELTSHGNRINNNGVLDPTGRLVVTGDNDGVIRVGPITGEEPHLLLGHEGPVTWLKVSPEGDWIASGGADHTVRLWPMPDMDKKPFHTLRYAEFLDRLRGLTNLRAVRDEESSTGYRIDIGPFPGWGRVPEW